jgi:GTP-binding protein
MINLFKLGDRLMLADLPGYGYAKVSRSDAEQWQREIVTYLHTRPALRRVILLIDARRGLMDSDRQVMGILDKAGVAYALVLTKTDKLRPSKGGPLLSDIHAELRGHAAALPQIYSTSAESGAGLDLLKVALAALAPQ